MRFKHYIEAPTLKEAAYIGNLGFEEMVKFYDVATDKQKKEMEKIIKKNDWVRFVNYVRKVLGVYLK